MTISILAESKPGSGNVTILYSPNVNQTVTGTVFCMNQSGYIDLISVALVANGNILTSNCWICCNTTIYPGESVYLQQLYLNQQDSIVVKNDIGQTGFIFNGTYF